MLTAPKVILTDGVVSLREILPQDSEYLYRWRTDPSSRPMFRDTALPSREAHERMISKYFCSDARDCWFIIEASQSPIGAVALYNFDDQGKVCEWGRFVIAPEWRGQGFGRRALRLLIEYAERSGMSSLRCEVLSTNAAALHLYRSLGFAEGAVRQEGGRSFVQLTIELAGRV